MAYGENGLGAAEYVALSGNNGNNRNGLFGDDLLGLIVLAALFGGGFGFGGGWGGGWGGGGGAGLQGIVTRADINEGFALNNILGGIQAIQQGICDSTYALNSSITGGFHGVERSMWDISRQISDCCCGTQRAIDGVNYNMSKNFCDLGNVIQNSTRDVIDNNNANYRGIMDFMVQEKLASKDAIIADLRTQVSQSNQNAVIGARIDAAVAEILRRTGAECPTAAYIVNAPTPVHFPTNQCGQVQFGCNSGCNGGWGGY